ncbi:MAG TPA: acylphosphatase [Stellaceae bacterium]|nr:acylphosphatase [Stellaceae bacterium]
MRRAVTALRLSIVGRVQGVGFRAWAVQEAMQRNLRGWVRNRRDGSVEALIIGEAEAVAAMATACRRGPLMAHVVEVRQDPADDDGSADFFERAVD